MRFGSVKNYNSDWDGLEGNINEFTSKELESGTYYYLVKNKKYGFSKKWDYSNQIITEARKTTYLVSKNSSSK